MLPSAESPVAVVPRRHGNSTFFFIDSKFQISNLSIICNLTGASLLFTYDLIRKSPGLRVENRTINNTLHQM